MKRMKKLASLFLASVMALSMTATAFAAPGDPGDGDGTLENPPAQSTTAPSTSGDPTNEFSITVTNPNPSISMDGKTYYAYKIFDVTYDKTTGETVDGEVTGAYSYKVAAGFEDFTHEGHTGQELVEYLRTIKDDADAVEAFAVAAYKHIDEKKIPESGHATAGSPASSVKIDLTVSASDDDATKALKGAGYYLVTGDANVVDGKPGQTVTAACALTTTQPDAEVTVKADAPSITKKIVEGTERVDANNAAVGDIVTYELTSTVPDMTGYTKYFFVVNDTMSKGLKFNDGSVSITVNGQDADFTVNRSGKKYDGSEDITIAIKNFIDYKADKGKSIVIQYTATITEDAVIGNTGNPNEVSLTYSNNPNEDQNGDPENPDKPGPGAAVGETPKDYVITYVTGIELLKVNGADQTQKLANATFKITGTSLIKVRTVEEKFEAADEGGYWRLKDGTYTTSAPIPDGQEGSNIDKYEEGGTKYKKTVEAVWTTKEENVEIEATSDENGILRFDGLGEGEYLIEETKAPDGYNKLEGPIKVNIRWAGPSGDVTDPKATATWTYDKVMLKADRTEIADSKVVDQSTDTIGRVNITVTNETGALLPSTGGIGTTIFYAAGIILMAGAVFFVIRRRRA